MKRIWFTQQKPFDYRPLRAGLGLITEQELNAPGMAGLCPKIYCPKIYTTRTHPLSGEYYVVEGSRFKAKPVEPGIEFRVNTGCRLCLRDGTIRAMKADEDDWFALDILERNGMTFPELDLGIRGSSFLDLRNVLLNLNPKSTIDTIFYISKLENS